MFTKVKGYHRWTSYSSLPISLRLQITSHPKEEYGEITGYQLVVGYEKFLGNTLKELNDKLINLASELKGNEVYVIWTDKLPAIKGFFRYAITRQFPEGSEKHFLYITIYDHLEFRDYTLWNKELTSTMTNEWWNVEIKKLYKEVFIPEKNYWLTPTQPIKKRLMKECDDYICKEIYPKNITAYNFLRKFLYGGLVYCAYPKVEFNDDMILVDMTSAYIWGWLCQPHIIEKEYSVSPSRWKEFLYKEDYATEGIYNIKFHCSTTKIKCYKDINGYHLNRDPIYESEEGYYKGLQHKVLCLNNIDLQIFLDLCDNVEEIECLSLSVAKVGKIPQDIAHVLADEYLKKQILPKNSEARRVQKVKLLSMYGISILKCDKTDFSQKRKEAVVPPQWGIWTTSYVKRQIFNLGNKLEGWRYTDTDCILCKDTPENRKQIEYFNESIREKVKEACDYYNLDFDDMKHLGEFKLEYEINKMKAIATKEYMFTTKEGEFIVKAAGCDKQKLKEYDDLYDRDMIPTGDRIQWEITDNSYYEWVVKEEDYKNFLDFQILLLNYLSSI